jgi:sporulation protein YlmC with PRC-barrel domain
MLETITALRHLGIHASDGDIGKVVDVFFDDESWTARYFVVETGGWLRRRRVLVSPIAVVSLDEHARSVAVDLTRDQIAQSPSVRTAMPLSRQKELKYRDYFAWPIYWLDTYVEAYSPVAYPRLAAADEAVRAGHAARKESLLPQRPRGDPHLRSAGKIIGYTVMASDGAAGHLKDLLIDSDGRTIRSLLVHADQVPNGDNLLLPPNLVGDIKWSTSAIHVHLSRREIGKLQRSHVGGA